jgi:hypothetical protein
MSAALMVLKASLLPPDTATSESERLVGIICTVREVTSPSCTSNVCRLEA